MLLFNTFHSKAQSFSIERPENNSEKFQKLILELENISFENFNFINNEHNLNPKYKILITEYLNGVIENENVLFETNETFGNFIDNKLSFSIIGKLISNNEYKILFNINSNLFIKQNFELIEANNFEIKHFFNQNMNFIPGEKTLLFAVVKPIKISDNYYRSCDFNAEKQNSDKWFETFGIDNYITIEIVFK